MHRYIDASLYRYIDVSLCIYQSINAVCNVDNLKMTLLLKMIIYVYIVYSYIRWLSDKANQSCENML